MIGKVCEKMVSFKDVAVVTAILHLLVDISEGF
jgi:hypothetical protein